MYIITAAEMSAAGISSGASFTKIGFNYQAGSGVAATAPLKIYLQNTADTTNTKSTTWATAITGMTTVHNASTTLPAATGPFDITLAGGSPFTYTGGGLYVAFDWGAYTGTLTVTAVAWCSTTITGGLKGAQTTAATAPTTIAASNFRPETRLTPSAGGAANDASVEVVQTLGALPQSLVGPHVVQAVIKNKGSNTLTNLQVFLDIIGADVYSDSQTIASLAACTGTATVSFAGFSPSNLGTDPIEVSLPNDDVPSNNLKSKNLDVTANLYSYKHAGTQPGGGAGFTGATGEFLARFTPNVATQVDTVNVEFFGATTATYRVVIRGDNGSGQPGAQLYMDGADRTVPGGGGAFAIRLPSPVAIPAGNSFLGIAQTNTNNANFSFDAESPIRAGTFFFSTTPSTGPWVDFSPGTDFKLNVGAYLGACLVPLSVDVTPDGATAVCNPGGSIQFNLNVSGGTGTYTYQWTQDGVDIAGANSPVYTATQASAGSHTYNCKVTDDAGCTNVVDGSSSTGTWIADGGACNDGNNCTAPDTCSAGSCAGPAIFVPGQVTNLNVSPNKQTLTWDSAAPSAGFGTVHDVPRGLVSQLPVGSGGSEICLTPGGIAAATTTDASTPASGDSYWYLVRGRNSCGTGSYGFQSNATERVTSVCP